ncbi:DUF6286 domain-containing protein [Actinosynnema sp. CS-041913]|uniref:DUF6286 domain-containing protein n=1 Tax=Actinosynnema sp. CS-041913 TaxID=3239917 RepID=UPI003D936F30
MRVLLRLLSPFLGLAVAGIGVLLIAEVAWQSAGRGHLIPGAVTDLPGLSWTDDRVRVPALITAIAGLLLLVIALTARRRFVRLHAPGDGIVVTTSATAVARVVGHRVRQEEGVSGASVTASRRKVHVRATSRLHDEATLRPRLMEVVGETVRRLPIANRPKVSVVVHSPKDRPKDRPAKRSEDPPAKRSEDPPAKRPEDRPVDRSSERPDGDRR